MLCKRLNHLKKVFNVYWVKILKESKAIDLQWQSIYNGNPDWLEI